MIVCPACGNSVRAHRVYDHGIYTFQIGRHSTGWNNAICPGSGCLV